MRHHRVLTATLLLYLGTVALSGQSAAQGSEYVERQLRSEYQGKVLTLRHPYCGDHLYFRPDGEQNGGRACGSWTADGQVRVKDLHFSGTHVQIEARRLFLAYDAASNQFRDILDIGRDDPLVRHLSSYGKKKPWQKLTALANVELDLDSGSSTPQLSDLEGVMKKVFGSPEEDPTDLAPDYWRPFLLKVSGKTPEKPPTSDIPFTKVGGDVKPPHALSNPDPDYTEVARQAGFQGTTLLWMIIDAEGKVRDIRVVRALGLGLDDQAVEKVRNWTFEPARRAGDPVAVQVNVEVKFRLY